MAKKEKKKKSFLNDLLGIFLLTSIILSGILIYGIYLYDGIETIIRYIIMSLLGLNDIRLIIKFNKIIKGKTKKKPKKKLFLFGLILYSAICGFLAYELINVYGKISNVNKTDVTYTSYLIVKKDSPVKGIGDVTDLELGILSDKKSPDGYIVPQLIIKEHKLQDDNEIVDYDDYTSMMVDLYEGNVDGIFITSNYVSMFEAIPGYENIKDETRIIAKKSKTMKKTSTSSIESSSTGKDITQPFTILLMGIDSTDEVLTKNAIANGDTLILITFNPKTLNATMLSIPRDSYVPISCWSGKPENKITHAAAYGNDCMINTIEDYFDTNIDYYAKINFKGLVKLVDAVGGVEVDVPKRLCTDDSSRGREICINEGHQLLNGEQALVYARNRKQLANGDFGRAEHQQEIIKALVNKMKDIKNVKKFMEILDTVSNSLDTNLTTKQILSFYDIGKDIIKRSLSSDDADLINIQQLFLQGSGQMIYDERARMVLWDYVPNKSSRKDIINAMKVNLELIDHTDVKEFHFSINEPYEKKVIGEGPYSSTGVYSLLPDFTGDTEAQARATASRLGISVVFQGSGGTVVSQSYPANKRIDLIKGSVTLTLSGNSKTDKEKDKDKDKDKDDDKDDKKDDKDDNKQNDDGNGNNNDTGGGNGTGTEPNNQPTE